MRREDEVGVRTECLERCPHLTQVPMGIPHPVRTIVVGHFGEEQLALGRIACPADPARRVGDDRGPRQDEASGLQRREREQDGRRIAARIRDHRRAADRRACGGPQLRHTIWNSTSAIRSGVAVSGTQVAREVDDPGAGRDGPIHPRQRRPMREGAEDDGGVRQRHVVWRREGDLAATNSRALAPLLVGRGEGEREVWMPRHEGADFTAGVSAGPQDSHGDRIHVIMHNHAS